jgi:hypothetical protein
MPGDVTMTPVPAPGGIEAVAGTGRRAPAEALALAAGSVLFVLALAHHDAGGPPTGVADAVHQLAAEGGGQRLVHALLCACAALLAFGYSGLAMRLGLSRAPVRAGLIAYAIATFAVMAQTLLDGIVLPQVAARFAQAPDADLAALKPVLVFAGALLGTLFQVWVLASSIAILLWSAALAIHPGSNRAAAALGVAAGILPLAALPSPALHSLAGIGALAGAQSLWGLAVAAQLARGRL